MYIQIKKNIQYTMRRDSNKLCSEKNRFKKKLIREDLLIISNKVISFQTMTDRIIGI